jgi:hypothetical protein
MGLLCSYFVCVCDVCWTVDSDVVFRSQHCFSENEHMKLQLA